MIGTEINRNQVSKRYAGAVVALDKEKSCIMQQDVFGMLVECSKVQWRLQFVIWLIYRSCLCRKPCHSGEILLNNATDYLVAPPRSQQFRFMHFVLDTSHTVHACTCSTYHIITCRACSNQHMPLTWVRQAQAKKQHLQD